MIVLREELRSSVAQRSFLQAFDDTVASLQDREGFALVIFSHEVRHAYGRAEYISVISDGRIVEEGERETLLRSEHEVIRRLLKRRVRERA